MLEWKSVRQPVQNALGDRDEFGESTLLAILFAGDTQHASPLAKVYLPQPTKLTFPAIDSGIEGYTITHSPARYSVSDPANDSGSFMAHNNRWTATPGTAIHPMNVAAADAAGHDRNQNLSRSRLRVRNVLVREQVVFFKNQSFHGKSQA